MLIFIIINNLKRFTCTSLVKGDFRISVWKSNMDHIDVTSNPNNNDFTTHQKTNEHQKRKAIF